MVWATCPADDDARPKDDHGEALLTVQRHQDLFGQSLGLSIIITPADVWIERCILGDGVTDCAGVVRVDGSGVDQPFDIRRQACMCNAAGRLNFVLGEFCPGLHDWPGQVIDVPYSSQGRGDVTLT